MKQKQVEQNKKEAKMYSNMFARLSKLEASEKVLICWFGVVILCAEGGLLLDISVIEASTID
jgi:hypothetical protein